MSALPSSLSTCVCVNAMSMTGPRSRYATKSRTAAKIVMLRDLLENQAMTIRQAASTMGLSKNTVCRLAKYHGIRPMYRFKNEQQSEREFNDNIVARLKNYYTERGLPEPVITRNAYGHITSNISVGHVTIKPKR